MKITYKNNNKKDIKIGDVVKYYGDGDESICLVVDSGIACESSDGRRYKYSLLELDSLKIIVQFTDEVTESEIFALAEKVELIIN